MSRRWLAGILVLWVCLVLPLESFASGSFSASPASASAAEHPPHHDHHAMQAGDTQAKKCCKSGQCPHCVSAGTRAGGCHSPCSAGAAPALAFDNPRQSPVSAPFGAWPPVPADISPPHNIRRLRPPIV